MSESTGRYIGLLEAIAMAANEAASSHQALQRALTAICDSTGWPVGHALVRAEHGRLFSSRRWHVASHAVNVRLEAFRRTNENVYFSMRTDLPGQVMAERRAAWKVPLRRDDAFPRYTLALRAGLHACYAFPVLAAGDVVAVLEFYTVTAQVPGEELLALMERVGCQLGRVFERESAQQRAYASEWRYQRILDAATNAFIGIDVDNRITAWNTAAVKLFGWSQAEALGQSIGELLLPERYRQTQRSGLARFLKTGKSDVIGRSLEISACHRSGHEIPIEVTLWAIYHQEAWEFFAFASDITERRRAQQALEHRAHYDTLTNLPNRGLLFERLSHELAIRDAGNLALLFIDLDHFKRVNDTLGHNAGDQVLLAVTRRIVSAVRPNDMTARLAGDEFVVLCPGVDDFHQATLVARRINEALSRPIVIGGDSVFVTASVGIAMADQKSDAETLLMAADTAMYEAKDSGRGHYQLFNERMGAKVATRLHLERDLREALEHDQLQLHYQPIVTSASGRIDNVEALLRWHHPQRGIIMPRDFIPLAEESGLIVPIGSWVLEQACLQARRWAKAYPGDTPIRVSINLSGHQLAQANLIDNVRRILDTVCVDATLIQFGFEVTETVMMHDPDAAAETLNALRALGAHVSIDDFGTGYSSLAYLKHFPLNALKIDHAFIKSVGHDRRDQAIVGSIVTLAGELGLSVVAEGVENEAQVDALRNLGVDQMQGYFFARPKPVEELEQWFLTRR